MKNEWYLRTQDETFGPETKERLIEWARMGRIQPGQDISEDGENWLPATEIPFLDMRWSIDIGDGHPRGPFNKHAAQALLASGRLPRGSKLVEVRPTFTEPTAAPPNVPSYKEPTEAPKPPQDPGDVKDLKHLNDLKDAPSPPGSQEVEALREQVAKLEAKIDRLVNQIGIKRFSLHVHPYVAAYINQGVFSLRLRWQMKYGLGIRVIPSQKMAFLQYEFYDSNREFIDMREENEVSK